MPRRFAFWLGLAGAAVSGALFLGWSARLSSAPTTAAAAPAFTRSRGLPPDPLPLARPARIRPERALPGETVTPQQAALASELDVQLECEQTVRVLGTESTGANRTRWWCWRPPEAGAQRPGRWQRVRPSGVTSMPGTDLTSVRFGARAGRAELYDELTGQVLSFDAMCPSGSAADVLFRDPLPWSIYGVDASGATVDRLRVRLTPSPRESAAALPPIVSASAQTGFRVVPGRYRVELSDDVGPLESVALEFTGANAETVVEVPTRRRGRVLVAFRDAEGARKRIPASAARELRWTVHGGSRAVESRELVRSLESPGAGIEGILGWFADGESVGVDASRVAGWTLGPVRPAAGEVSAGAWTKLQLIVASSEERGEAPTSATR